MGPCSATVSPPPAKPDVAAEDTDAGLMDSSDSLVEGHPGQGTSRYSTCITYSQAYEIDRGLQALP
jgi:hypothetical protein